MRFTRLTDQLPYNHRELEEALLMECSPTETEAKSLLKKLRKHYKRTRRICKLLKKIE